LINQIFQRIVSMTTKTGKGGKREGAGRKPKVHEVKLVESMDAISVPSEIWKALLYKCLQGDTGALKLWLSYRYGLPRQQLDITTNGENIAPPIQWISKQIEFNEVDAIEFETIPNKIEIQLLDNEEDM
jgi:hypothetical protein